MSPTCTQSGTFGWRVIMSWMVLLAQWMSPNAPICMGGRGWRGWSGGRVSRCSVSCLSCPPCLHASFAGPGDSGGNEQISFVPHEVVFAVDRELVVFAHEDRADRTRLF